jgi:hypothetical protein
MQLLMPEAGGGARIFAGFVCVPAFRLIQSVNDQASKQARLGKHKKWQCLYQLIHHMGKSRGDYDDSFFVSLSEPKAPGALFPKRT